MENVQVMTQAIMKAAKEAVKESVQALSEVQLKEKMEQLLQQANAPEQMDNPSDNQVSTGTSKISIANWR